MTALWALEEVLVNLENPLNWTYCYWYTSINGIKSKIYGKRGNLAIPGPGALATGRGGILMHFLANCEYGKNSRSNTLSAYLDSSPSYADNKC